MALNEKNFFCFISGVCLRYSTKKSFKDGLNKEAEIEGAWDAKRVTFEISSNERESLIWVCKYITKT